MVYVFYCIVLFLTAIYSYSQIDLSLTLSSNPLYQNIQHKLILLGYYNRPLSTGILVVLLLFLYSIYVLILLLVRKNKLSRQNIFHLVILTSVILLFSYTVFSHDLFNYMFDARIVTTYHQNPYIHSALDFPTDLWTRFMHWTHRTYPYGPIWLLITLPFSSLGFGKFVLTLFNFKLMFTLFHAGNAYFIYKILTKLNPKLSLLGTAVYAFNPVVLFESLVSPHNEVTMLFLLLLAVYQILVKNNRLFAIIFILLSAGIKFVTLILLPLFLIPAVIPNVMRNLAKRINLFLLLILFFLIPPLLYEIYIREPYSWYFIPLIGIGALLVKYTRINILISGISLAAFLRYLPFIYMGDYSKPVRNMQDLIFISAVSATFLIIFIYSFAQKMINKKTE